MTSLNWFDVFRFETGQSDFQNKREHVMKSLHACLSNFKVGSGGILRERTGTPSCSASGVLMLTFVQLFRIVSDLHNYKVLYGEKCWP